MEIIGALHVMGIELSSVMDTMFNCNDALDSMPENIMLT